MGPRATFRVRARPATLERRERAALIHAINGVRARSTPVKQSLKSHLFGIAITLSVFVAFVSPMVAKRW